MGKKNPCRGVLATAKMLLDLGDELFRELNKLLLAERFSHGDNFEKLHASTKSHMVFSVRLNHKARLLLTKHELGGHCYWVLLDHLEHHEYHKSPFLKRTGMVTHFSSPAILGELNRHLEAQGLDARTPEGKEEAKASTGSEIKTEASPSPGITPAPVGEETITPSEVHLFNRELIVLNKAQEDALTMREPMLVMGMPGSGKSTVALSYLIGCAVPTEKVLYVAQSPLLVREIEAAWRSNPLSKTAPDIEFLSYKQLMLQEHPELYTQNESGRTEFIDWFASKLSSKAFKSLFGDKNPFLVYQELRIISGMTKEQYLDIGARESSLFMSPSHTPVRGGAAAGRRTRAPEKTGTLIREELYGLYESYCTFLIAEKRYDLSFMHLKPAGKYTHIAVDEAQDLSTQQLDNLQQFARTNLEGKPCVAYFADGNQSIIDAFPKFNFFKNHLNIKHIGELPGTFRCSTEVRRMANAVLAIRGHVTGGALDKGVATFIPPTAGESRGKVQFIEEMDEATYAMLELLTTTTQCAIITTKEEQQKIKKRREEQEEIKSSSKNSFLDRAVLVLTVEECKGLEYKTIILYRMLSHPMYESMNSLLVDYKHSDAASPSHRAGPGEADYQYYPLLHGLFTAVTRASQSLLICEVNPNKKTRNLIGAIKSALPASAPLATAVEPPRAPSSITDWEAEMRKQLGRGNREIACDIARQYLKMSASEFNSRFPIAEPTASISTDRESKRERKEHQPKPGRESKGTPVKREEQQPPTMPSAKKAPTLLAVRTEVTPLIKQVLEASDKTLFASLLSFLKQDDFGTQLFSVDAGNGLSLFETLRSLPAHSSKLNLLFDMLKKPEFAIKITTPLWCNAYYIEQDKFFAPTPLYVLTQSQKSISLLSTLLDNNPELINSELFYNTLYKTEIRFNNTSALYWLCAYPEGQAVLRRLIVSNTGAWATEAAVTALCHSLTDAAGADENTSGLYWLCVTPDGRALLARMINANTGAWATEAAVTALCRSRTAAAGVEENASGLYWLCRFPEGRALLGRLIGTSPDAWATEAVVTALCRFRPDAAGIDESSSSLYQLCSFSKGIALLERLIEINPRAWATEAVVSALCRFQDMNGSGFYWLCILPEGKALLYRLIEINPRIWATEDVVTSLCRSRTFGREVLENSSVLYRLCATPWGRALLDRLIEANTSVWTNERVVMTLCHYLETIEGAIKNTSIVSWLSDKHEVQNLIAKLTKLTDGYPSALSVKTLVNVPSRLIRDDEKGESKIGPYGLFSLKSSTSGDCCSAANIQGPG